MTRAERLARAMTLAQYEKLLLVSRGAHCFHAQAARSIGTLIDKEILRGDFDISTPDPLRGRVHEIWREVAITDLGREVLNAAKSLVA
ncbi:hypothetical protein [Sphingobium lignivorans]|uniref:DCC family thiol-disulfide oxidoreductase YuxK n=1 Tax=Sphingobium lignivorans TaxID=2735886 RepID=A0ABR6NG00_9SPHN|nr:hypothetical protein [Sphingobium lignivorans]MBB5986001.1 putative DCC family thiol-disulfide oxidoreductase YuxK [Sphingobium lignivorans]